MLSILILKLCLTTDLAVSSWVCPGDVDGDGSIRRDILSILGVFEPSDD